MAELLGSPLFPLLVLGFFVIVAARPLWRMWNVYAGAPTRRQFDASELGLQPPSELWPYLSELLRLGFRRLGEAQLDVTGIRAADVASTNEQSGVGRPDRHTVFAFVDADATVMAETTAVPHAPTLLSFSTIFADGTVVETMYPRGESIHDPDFHSGHNKHSLESAFADQRAEIDRWRMHHGSPRVISNMADYLRADADYRERFAKRKLRRPFLLYQVLPVVVVFLLLALFLVWLFDLLPF
jgi:hypothetical protein